MEAPDGIDKIQKLTSFPNQNHKHIDYVIVYEEDFQLQDEQQRQPNENSTRMRENFFAKLRQEQFEIHFIESIEDKKKKVYALLHCSIERLYEEAEAFRLEMRLKNFKIEEATKETSFLNKIKYQFLRPLKNDQHGKIISTQFDRSIKFIFEGVDDSKNYPNGPFNNTIRSLLVDNILMNISFLDENEMLKLKVMHKINDIINISRNSNANGNGNGLEANLLNSLMNKAPRNATDHAKELLIEKSLNIIENLSCYKGLPFMLKEKYFLDAYILHEESYNYLQLHDFLNYVDQLKRYNQANVSKVPDLNQDQENSVERGSCDQVMQNEKLISSNLKSFENSANSSDVRYNLYTKWAKFRNIFRYQPMWDIRNYFGETSAFYFAWLGVFISSLWLPSLIGVVFFGIGLSQSIRNPNKTVSLNTNTSGFSIYTDYYGETFAESFDNDLMPYFSLIICLWGAIFMEIWKQENSRLAFEWDVENFERFETDLPDYLKKRREREKSEPNFLKELYWKYEKYIKNAISAVVILFMISIVALDIALVVVFRIFIKYQAFPNSDTLKLIFGDVGSIVINTCLIMLFNFIYKKIAIALTKWENYRTKTEYEDALILKLFAFEFVNSYGSLFYLAYFRNIPYPNGYFGIGPEYTDKCNKDNCMSLLTIQLMIILIIKPLPRFTTSVIYPLLKKLYNRKVFNERLEVMRKKELTEVIMDDKSEENIKDKSVLLYLNVEMSKTEFADTISEEYIEKILLYGYLILFGGAFSLAPLIILIINLIDMRVDAQSMLWLYRRPIGYKSQDIGIGFSICRFLNVLGIVNHGFMAAFTSNWAKYFFINLNERRFIFIIVFEHLAFFIWLLIVFILPDIPAEVQKKMREEIQYVKEIISTAKTMKQNNIISSSSEKKANGFEFPTENTVIMEENFNKYKTNLEKSIRSNNNSIILTNRQVTDESSVHQRNNKIYPVL